MFQEAVKAVKTVRRASRRLLKTPQWADFLCIYLQFKAGDESKVAAVASAARRVCVCVCVYSRLFRSPEVTLISTQTPSDMLTVTHTFFTPSQTRKHGTERGGRGVKHLLGGRGNALKASTWPQLHKFTSIWLRRDGEVRGKEEESAGSDERIFGRSSAGVDVPLKDGDSLHPPLSKKRPDTRPPLVEGPAYREGVHRHRSGDGGLRLGPWERGKPWNRQKDAPYKRGLNKQHVCGRNN